ncbi:MAG: methylated-DNA--[protein]-cysteine S-methyltransferase [Alistipes sp.]
MPDLFFIETPVGRLGIASDERAIHAVFYSNTQESSLREPITPLQQQAQQEFKEYFAGERQIFDLPLATEGTPFQQAVWHALQTIPYGETRSYKQLAAQIGHPKATRAVGMANNRNPIAILIPCHRVIGANGQLVGYAGGLPIKAQLLRLEKVEILKESNSI